jgi:hypothetical protein
MTNKILSDPTYNNPQNTVMLQQREILFGFIKTSGIAGDVTE